MTTFAITGAHIVPISGEEFDGTIVVADGKIVALGPDVAVPDGAEVVDAMGRWVLPGLIDAHVHVGTHEEGEGSGDDDTNEMTDPVTAGVRAIDAINPFDPGFDEALKGGITTVNVNPGSGNAIGGQAATLKTFGRRVDDMVMRAPSGVKSALGENPKRVYGGKDKTPSTRLGTAMVIRKAFAEAQNWIDEGKTGRNIALEPLIAVLKREIPWRQHSHRADDIATALRLQEEFGYDLVIDHGTEAHVIADVLAEKGVPVLIGPLFTTKSKVELRGRSIANPGKLARAGVEISLITDHPVIPINFLMHQVTLAIKEGLDRETALRAVTINPAKVLGVDARVGSLEVGKDADLVLWSTDPVDIMARAERVWIDGVAVGHYDAATADFVVIERAPKF